MVAASADGCAATAVHVIQYIKSSIDPAVLGATATASYKLFLVCAAVGWLLKTNKIPDATASVLSQACLIAILLFHVVDRS